MRIRRFSESVLWGNLRGRDRKDYQFSPRLFLKLLENPRFTWRIREIWIWWKGDLVGKRVFLRACRLESKGWLVFFFPSSFSCLCGFVCTCCACVDYGVNRLKIQVLCFFLVWRSLWFVRKIDGSESVFFFLFKKIWWNKTKDFVKFFLLVLGDSSRVIYAILGGEENWDLFGGGRMLKKKQNFWDALCLGPKP